MMGLGGQKALSGALEKSLSGRAVTLAVRPSWRFCCRECCPLLIEVSSARSSLVLSSAAPSRPLGSRYTIISLSFSRVVAEFSRRRGKPLVVRLCVFLFRSRSLKVCCAHVFSSHLGFVHPLQDVALHQCLPSSSVCCLPNPVVPSFSVMSSCHLLLGRPLDLFPLLGCHSVHRLVHLLSFNLAI